jgi:DNA polymerase IIIc chi subunit
MLEFSSPEFLHSFTQAIHLVVVDHRERRDASRKYWVQLRDAGFALRHQKV